MLTAGQNDYRVCLMDTNALSELVKPGSEAIVAGFLEWATGSELQVVPAFNVFTLMELRRSPQHFERFLEMFSVLSIVLVKSFEDLLAAELAAYPDSRKTDFVSLAFTPLGGSGNQMANLPGLLAAFEEEEQQWNQGRFDLVEALASNAKTYLAANGPIGRNEAAAFLWSNRFQLLCTMAATSAFVRQELERDRAIDVDAFPSVRAMASTIFYKFYEDSNRLAAASDAFDVFISSSLPYVDALVTENHQAEVVRKIKNREAFLEGVTVFTLRDLRRGLSG